MSLPPTSVTWSCTTTAVTPSTTLVLSVTVTTMRSSPSELLASYSQTVPGSSGK